MKPMKPVPLRYQFCAYAVQMYSSEGICQYEFDIESQETNEEVYTVRYLYGKYTFAIKDKHRNIFPVPNFVHEPELEFQYSTLRDDIPVHKKMQDVLIKFVECVMAVDNYPNILYITFDSYEILEDMFEGWELC